MSMKVYIAAIALLSGGIANASELNRTCWDGSFAYNYATVHESSRGVELSLKGNSLKAPPLVLDWGKVIQKESWSYGEEKLHILFPKSSLVRGKDGQIKLSVKAVSIKDADGFIRVERPIMWSEQSIKSLGEFKSQILDIDLESAKLNINENTITLTIDQDKDNAKDQVISLVCRNEQDHQGSAFPSELLLHLDSKLSESSK